MIILYCQENIKKIHGLKYRTKKRTHRQAPKNSKGFRAKIKLRKYNAALNVILKNDIDDNLYSRNIKKYYTHLHLIKIEKLAIKN